MKNRQNLVLCTLLASCLPAACGKEDELADLRESLARLDSQHEVRPLSLPGPGQKAGAGYDSKGLRSPFQPPPGLAQTRSAESGQHSIQQPDKEVSPDASPAVSQLQRVGSLRGDKGCFLLMRDSFGTVHKVSPGDFPTAAGCPE